MITALISTVLGIFGGIVPDIMKEVRESREHDREVERMKLQSDLQLKLLQVQAQVKLEETDANLVVEQIKASGEQMRAILEAQKPVQIPWIDGFNALIRPATAALMMLLFFVISALYSYAIIDRAIAIGPAGFEVAATAIWGSLVGEAIQAVLGFLFGYRSTRSLVRLR
ncbi:MAG: hypothetical protein ACO3S8_01965 [Aquiluna sp.]|jgi:hypothetical protein